MIIFSKQRMISFLYFSISLVGLSILLTSLTKLNPLNHVDLLVFSMFNIFATFFYISLPSGMTMSLSFPFIVCVLLIFNSVYAMWAILPGFLIYQIVEKKPFKKMVFNISQLTISIYLAGLWVGSGFGEFNLLEDAWKIILIIITFDMVNAISVSLMLALEKEYKFWNVFMECWGIESPESMLIYYAIGAIMAVCYRAQGFTGVVLVTIPVIGLISLMKAKKDLQIQKSRAHTDALTQLNNRYALLTWCENNLGKLLKNPQNLSVIMIDLDDFKKINDAHGHDVGDEVLKQVAQTIKSSTRKSDLVFRYGGEEFVVILPDTHPSEANPIALRICAAIAESVIPTCGGIKVTASVGVSHLTEALVQERENLANEMIRQADKAMYLAKQCGKNQVQAYV